MKIKSLEIEQASELKDFYNDQFAGHAVLLPRLVG